MSGFYMKRSAWLKRVKLPLLSKILPSEICSLPSCLQNTSCFQFIYLITLCCLHQSFHHCYEYGVHCEYQIHLNGYQTSSYLISRLIQSICFRFWVESIINNFLVLLFFSATQAFLYLSMPRLSSFFRLMFLRTSRSI